MKKRAGFSAMHFYVWLIVGAMFYAGDALASFFGISALLPLLLAPLAALVAVMTFILGLVVNLWRRRWRRLASVFAAPVLTAGLLVALGHAGITPDWLRFQLARGHYMAQVRALPGPLPKYREWYWGESGGLMQPNIFYYLVYDETDRPLEQSRWKQASKNGAICEARSYGHHFFFVTELYQ